MVAVPLHYPAPGKIDPEAAPSKTGALPSPAREMELREDHALMTGGKERGRCYKRMLNDNILTVLDKTLNCL